MPPSPPGLSMSGFGALLAVWLPSAVGVIGCGPQHCLPLLRCAGSHNGGDTEGPKVESRPGIANEPLTDLPAEPGELTNLDSLRHLIGVAPWQALGFRGKGVTIAVLDNGFLGLKSSLGKTLPPDTQVLGAKGMQATAHGTRLAEIIYALATGNQRWDGTLPGPRLLLINANGFANLTAAIDTVIRVRPDIVVYAQVWEYGGNGDGSGFINRDINRALAAGTLWVNAAGNLELATWSGPLVLTPKRDAELPYRGQYVRFSVPQDGVPVRIALAWNDFDTSRIYRTRQDLDLVLETEEGVFIKASRLVQRGKVMERRPDDSAMAREIIDATLPAGVYRLRVEAISNNFDASSRLRLTASGAGVRMLDNAVGDSILIPADNPGVLTVGATDSPESSRSGDARTHKPEVLAPSSVEFSNGEKHRGTSAAAAVAAATLCIARQVLGTSTRDEVLAALEDGRLSPVGSRDHGLSGAKTIGLAPPP